MKNLDTTQTLLIDISIDLHLMQEKEQYALFNEMLIRNSTQLNKHRLIHPFSLSNITKIIKHSSKKKANVENPFGVGSSFIELSGIASDDGFGIIE